MLSRRTSPLRPVSLLRSSALPRLQGPAQQRPRLFTQNHPLQLVTRANSLRPQVPYLSQPIRPLPAGPALQRQLARLLTTETKQYVQKQTWLAIKWSAVGWSFLFLASVAYYGWQSELIERENPSPAEWRYVTRVDWRAAHTRLNSGGIIDWAKVGTDFRHAMERLEDVDKDGKGLKDILEQEGDGETMIAGVGRAGYDITEKSWEWRSGYFQVLMGCALAAEHLDDMVRDKGRQLVFPKEYMIGPSNPYPRPVPPNMEAAPLEENCDRPYAPPETFYMRVLTGKGFTTKQRLDAAMAYGNWLEYKRANEAAEEVYKWAVDIAASAIPTGDLAVDRATGILKEASNTQASPNLLRAATALATHQAHSGNVTSALPIYLSVLRARRTAPVDPYLVAGKPGSRKDAVDYGPVYDFLRTFIRSSHFPAEGLSGDEPLSRPANVGADCSESELMLYIGEILFATSTSNPDDGIGWTKQAVEVAQRGIKEAQSGGMQDLKQCRTCLEIGVTNWSKMVAKLAVAEKASKEREGNTSKAWGGWFGSSKKIETTSNWEEEAIAVEALRQKLVRDGIMEQMVASGRSPSNGWMV